jgi:hypothetical protein
MFSRVGDGWHRWNVLQQLPLSLLDIQVQGFGFKSGLVFERN